MRQLSRFHVAISRDASTRVLGEPILGNSIQTSHHGVRVCIISVIRTVSVADLPNETSRFDAAFEQLSFSARAVSARRRAFYLI